MARPANIPPPLIRPRRSNEPAIFFAFVAGAIVVALATGYFGIGLPQCNFKRLTGLPCAFCGGTRSLRALGHLHFHEAFFLNPLVTIGAIGAGICAVFWLIAPQRFDRFVAWVKKFPLLPIGLGLVVVNWIFVLKFLPR